MAPYADVLTNRVLSSFDLMEQRKKRLSRTFSLPMPRPSKMSRVASFENIVEEDENGDYDSECSVRTSASVVEPSIYDSRDRGTEDDWIMRNPSMIRLTGKHPFNAEAPLRRLLESGFITPAPLHYVRNHGAVPKATWDDWTVEIGGLVNKPMNLTMDELTTKFPSMSFPVTMVCSGNRRKEQNMVKQTVGFNWGSGAASTSVWKGVPLWAVLQRCEVLGPKHGAHYVCFEGGDSLPGGGGTTYGTSLKLEFAMDPARDIILAYKQNGELLPPDHGFPLRVIVPGFTGGRMVKWLKRITVTSAESDNHYHYHDNRVLPSHVDSKLASEGGWFKKPEYIINELGVNSVIAAPSHSEVLPITVTTSQKPYAVKGYAYTGGGRKVTRVELSLDGGNTWRVCNVNYEGKPSRYGKYWFWCFWSLDVEVVDLIGAKEIAVRAWDESHNTQPEKLIWNLMGMMNNSWFRINVNVRKESDGSIGLQFEHPVVPGNENGGWMDKHNSLGIGGPLQREEKEKDNGKESPLLQPSINVKTFSVAEVEVHNHAESAWIIVDGHVYDCTNYLKEHPGGSNSILINAGTDCTEEFHAIHSDDANKLLQKYRIGELAATSGANSEKAAVPHEFALVNPKEKVACKLIKKEVLSSDSRLLRFSLPSENQKLGLPVGKHVYICATIDGKLCMRAYTPSSGVDAKGYFDLVIRVYFKNVDPSHPEGGLMSQHLDSLPIGSTVQIKGPVGHIEYLGKGEYIVNGKQKYGKKLAMVAGGTGITPMYQVIQAVLGDPDDETEMHLVYANRTEEDILLREELDRMAKEHPHRFRLWYVVSRAVREGWSYSTGRISQHIFSRHLPAFSHGVLALACGPPSMLKFSVQPILASMNYDVQDSLLLF